MESPQFYDNDFNIKKNAAVAAAAASAAAAGCGPAVSNGVLKVKNLYCTDDNIVGSNGADCELYGQETSIDIQKIMEENHLIQDDLVQDFQDLNVDKVGSLSIGSSSLSISESQCLRGLGAMPSSCPQNGMYSQLPYMPQPVHGGSQFDRINYGDHTPIKEEPPESEGLPHEFSPCALVGYGNGGSAYGGISPYPLTPTTVPLGVDPLFKSPMKSPTYGGMKGGMKIPGKSDRSTDEYRKRRERNNIAVRKSREKAKQRSRETEERVKMLCDENKRVTDEAKKMSNQIKMLFDQLFIDRDLLNTINRQCQPLPEPLQTNLRKRLELLNNYQPQQIVSL